jgi:GTP cyclohydrolase II
MPLAKVTRVADTALPTRWGQFRILGFTGELTGHTPCDEKLPLSGPNGTGRIEQEEAIALIMGDIHSGPPLVRIHSQCLTGDVFHSLRCDCRLQLELALRSIGEVGSGIILYDMQEGRGIGLMAKLKAYELQEQGLDTVEANLKLGYKADCREFELQAAMLKDLGVPAVRLLTNNPEKVAALERAGVQVIERISAEVPVEQSFEHYLEVKREKMGHLFTAEDEGTAHKGAVKQPIIDQPMDEQAESIQS